MLIMPVHNRSLSPSHPAQMHQRTREATKIQTGPASKRVGMLFAEKHMIETAVRKESILNNPVRKATGTSENGSGETYPHMSRA
jgi:hypothetical protein